MNDSAVTTKEAGGWHRGRPVIRTVNEDEDLIVFHNDHVELNMNEGLDENEKMTRNQKELKVHPQKPRRVSPWRLQVRVCARGRLHGGVEDRCVPRSESKVGAQRLTST